MFQTQHSPASRIPRKRCEVTAPSAGYYCASTRPAVDDMQRRDLVMSYNMEQVFKFLLILEYFPIFYRIAPYLLGSKVLFRLAIVVSLDFVNLNRMLHL